MNGADGPPDRAEIESKWTAIIEGRVTREEVHAWAEPLMLGERISDLLVASALQSLHGFDLTTDLEHGPPGNYLRSLDTLVEELDLWRAECVEYDMDPEGWVIRARARGRKAAEERRKQADGA